MESTIEIRRREIDQHHIERMQRLCAARGVRMKFSGSTWSFRGHGVDVLVADLRYARAEDLGPAMTDPGSAATVRLRQLALDQAHARLRDLESANAALNLRVRVANEREVQLENELWRLRAAQNG